ncbi:MAG TPA: hypothetical protein VHF87_21465 [Methylomirabilota bacterium]|jgi:hypothetical protein|nr:hypothetical protein [Methylomirabilota bacterium]
MALGLLRPGVRFGWSDHLGRLWKRSVRVGQFPEVRVLPDVVDQGFGQESGERLDKVFWKWADTSLLLEAGGVPRGAVLAPLGRGRTTGREERIHVSISIHRRKPGPRFLGLDHGS